jgi:hypothetical protein
MHTILQKADNKKPRVFRAGVFWKILELLESIRYTPHYPRVDY